MLNDNHNYKLNICIGNACRADKNPYRHDRRADKNSYRHDHCADKNLNRHDRRADSQCQLRDRPFDFYWRGRGGGDFSKKIQDPIF